MNLQDVALWEDPYCSSDSTKPRSHAIDSGYLNVIRKDPVVMSSKNVEYTFKIGGEHMVEKGEGSNGWFFIFRAAPTSF